MYCKALFIEMLWLLIADIRFVPLKPLKCSNEFECLIICMNHASQGCIIH